MASWPSNNATVHCDAILGDLKRDESTMTVWQWWVVVGIALFILEVFTQGFFLASLGVSCAASAVVAYFGFGIKSQLLAFSLTTITVLVLIRPFVMRYLSPPKNSYKAPLKLEGGLHLVVYYYDGI